MEMNLAAMGLGWPSWTRNRSVSSVMSITGITFKTNTASEHDILSHLSECNNSFIPPLNNKVDLTSYAKKIAEKAITFEAWNEHSLMGLLAAYFNDSAKRTGYITNISIVPTLTGKGIGSVLLQNCINYGAKENYCEIKLEVNKLNIKAISLYKKYNFVQIDERDDHIIMRWNK